MLDSITPLLSDPAAWAALVTLIVMEVVLGIDNLIFISILSNKLPEHQRQKVRRLGIGLALIMRLALLSIIAWLVGLVQPVFTVMGNEFSWKDLILIAGGLFLVYKAVTEIHHKLEGAEEEHGSGKKIAQVTFASVITQILLLDIVFSLDSVITAVGMTESMIVIITVVVLSFGIMLFASRFIFSFVNKHPTVKMLALSFLLLIGVFLIAEGFGVHVDKALIYMPMAFAVLVEGLNLWAAARKARRDKKVSHAVQLRPTYPDVDESVAVAAALAGASGGGSVGLSSKPVSGSEGGEERAGLG